MHPMWPFGNAAFAVSLVSNRRSAILMVITTLHRELVASSGRARKACVK
jgi:hypothetical protein